MSATIEKPPATATERGAEATTQLREMFSFDKLSLMSTAIAEIVIAESKKNPAFAERVRQTYHELEKLPRKNNRGSRKGQKKRGLKAISRVEGYNFDPYAPLDPYYYYQIFGAKQFPEALREETLDGLKEAARKLMETHPGKPTSFAKKDAVIDYIVDIVTKGK